MPGMIDDALAWGGACLDSSPREYPRVITCGLSTRALKRVLAVYGERHHPRLGRWWSAFERPRYHWPKWAKELRLDALTCFTPDDLLNQRNFGAVSLREVQELLGRHGLALSGCGVTAAPVTERVGAAAEGETV